MKILIYLSTLFVFTTFAQTSTPPKSTEDLLQESQSVDWSEAVSKSVEINAPVEKTWAYASDSLQAVNWSIYFNHISPLEGPSPDGQIGSLRRCFRNKDESGYAWDEVIINVEPQKLRQIVTYNFINYPFNFAHENEYVFVRQLYESLGPDKSKLTFQTIPRNESNPFFRFIFWISRGKTGEIFLKNLENIKAAIEEKPRVHPWVED